MIKEIQIPQGVAVTTEINAVKVKGKLGENQKKLKLHEYKCETKDGKLTIKIENPSTRQKAYLGTIEAHIKNMIKGVQEGYEYKMKIVYKHFPINVSVEKDKFLIKNFAGEKKPRTAQIVGKTEVKNQGQDVIIKGFNLEDAGQTAANIEQATRIRKKDRRVFQDGIFITKKPE